MAAIKFTEQTGDGFDDKRIGVTNEETFSIPKLRGEPKFGKTAGNQIFVRAKFRRGRRQFFGTIHKQGQTILAILERAETNCEVRLFFSKRHGAAGNLFRRTWVFARQRRLA